MACIRHFLLIVLVAWAAAPAGADYKSDYLRGLEALERGDWPQARRLLAQAIAEVPDEGRVRLYGMQYQPYLPHFYLGVALLRLDDCEAALGAWMTSEEQAFITRFDEYQELQEHRSTCRETLTSQALAAAGRRVEQAAAAELRLASLRRDPLLAETWQPGSELAEEERRAAELLADARRGLASAQSPAAADEAGRLADRARQRFESILAGAREHRSELAAANLEPFTTTVGQAAGQEEGPVLMEPPATIAAPNFDRDTSSSAAPGSAAEEDVLPQALVRAARAYFRADYRQTLEILAGADLEGSSRVQGKLFEAAASYALYLLGGSDDESLRGRAQAAVAECYRLDPQLRVAGEFFSPRIRDFVERR